MRDEQHLWKKENCSVCELCGITKVENHIIKDCFCQKCDATFHVWKKDVCRVCERCGFVLSEDHKYEKNKCKNCGKYDPASMELSFDYTDKDPINIDELKKMNNLTSLRIFHKKFKDVATLCVFENLKELELFGTEIDEKDIAIISKLKNLTKLGISGYNIDFTFLNHLPNLQELIINRNDLKDIKFLSKINRLTHLDLSYNEIADISPLQELTNLEYLDLSENKIKNISTLSNLKNLKNLSIEGNELEDISLLLELDKLERLLIDDLPFPYRSIDGFLAIGIKNCYGIGIKQSYDIANKYFVKAANKDNALAQLMLGNLYNYGKGVTRDSKIAINWYNLAKAQGYCVTDYIMSIEIREQVWMLENIKTEKFRNGDLIPEAKTANEWLEYGKNGKPAWCYYKFNKENDEKYGKLYNWFSVSDNRELAPKGWHIPSSAELLLLISNVYKSGSALTLLEENSDIKEGYNGSGFSALLAGYQDCEYGDSLSVGYTATFWSSTEGTHKSAICMKIYASNSVVELCDFNKIYGFSVRCLKD